MNGTRVTPTMAKLGRELAVMLVAALVLAALGPFGTWQMDLGARLLAWAVFTFGGYLCFRPVILAGHALAAQSSLPRWLAIGLACMLAAMPTTLIVGGVFAHFRWDRISARDLADLYPQILIVGAVTTLIQLIVGHRHQPVTNAPAPPPSPGEPALPVPAAPPASPPPPVRPSLLDQLPPHLDGDILCVENEDHYVRVHTVSGSALVLMRLRDAIAQLDAIDGAQVHRGWWVARGAVAAVVRSDRRIALRLVDGREVPVSRSAAPDLRARGWI